jgi:hypothetical protein
MKMAQREKLPLKDFGLPGRGSGKGGKGPGSYPIDTAGRARSALSRASANASPAQQAEIKKKVKAKFPAIAVGGKKTERGGERGGGRKMVTVPASRSAAKARRG